MRKLSNQLTRYLSDSLQAELPFKLVHLWENWDSIVGEEAAYLVFPLGHRNQTLLLGVEDAAAMQEATYYAPYVLDVVNEFLGEIYFDKVQLDLLMGKTPLNAPRGKLQDVRRIRYLRPDSLGKALDSMDQDNPVARCYRKYVALFKK